MLKHTQKGKGTEKSGGNDGCPRNTLDSSAVSAPLVPPVCYRKAHSFNLLNGGNISETVNHKPVIPVGAKAAVQVSAK